MTAGRRTRPTGEPLRIRGLCAAATALMVVAAGASCTAEPEPTPASSPVPLEFGLVDVEPPPWANGELPEMESTANFSLPEEWELVDGEAGPSEPGDGLDQEWRLSVADADIGDDPDGVQDMVLKAEIDHSAGFADDSAWPGNNRSFRWAPTDFHELDAYLGEGQTPTRFGLRLGNWEVSLELEAPHSVKADEVLRAAALRVEFEPTLPADEVELNVLDSGTDLAQVCEGEHFANAAPYEGGAPHPTQIFVYNAEDNWTHEAWTGLWPGEWKPEEADPGDIQLVVCVDRREREVRSIGTPCRYIVEYTDPFMGVEEGTEFTATLEVLSEPIKLHEVKTGSIVAEMTVESLAACPERAYPGDSFYAEGRDPAEGETPSTVHNFLSVDDYAEAVESYVVD